MSTNFRSRRRTVPEASPFASLAHRNALEVRRLKRRQPWACSSCPFLAMLFPGGVHALRARGGTGRRAGLRILWSNPCRFDSCRAHRSCRPSLSTVAFRFPAYFPETSVWWCRAEPLAAAGGTPAMSEQKRSGYFTFFQPGPRTTQPGFAPVCWPFSST